MRLFEEYFKRHNIADVPVAHHCSTGSLILRTTDSSLWKNRWLLVTIRWVDHDHHPGEYHIDMNSPVHDGYLSETVFTKWPTNHKKWHEYEDFVMTWSENLKGVTPVRGVREVTLAAWEMFVFSYDSWFSRQPFDVKRMLFESLDKERPTDYRYQHYQDVAIFLATHHPAVLRAWKYEVLARVQNYADWLAAIVDDQCKEKKNTLPFKLEIP
jgi:hypothetical protein